MAWKEPNNPGSRVSSAESTLHSSHTFVLLRPLAFVVACIYPIFWVAGFAFTSLPALLEVTFSGSTLVMVRVSVFGSFLASQASGDPPTSSGFRMGLMGGFGFSGVFAAVLVGAVVWYFTKRRGALLGGLFVAMLGYVGWEQLLRQLLRESPGAGWFLAALILGGLWVAGLRRIIAQTARPGAGFGWRFVAAIVGFTIPVGALWLVLRGAVGMNVLRPFVWLFLPGLLPAALASLWPQKIQVSNRRPIRWRFVAFGTATTIGMAAALVWAGPTIGQSFVRAQAARADVMVADLPQLPATAPYPRRFFQRGVNFTAEFGAPYASPEALESLKRLREYGVNSVALVVYGWTSPSQPSVHVSHGLGVWESEEGIEDLARLAHSLGMTVFLKPQLWVRGGSTTRLDFSDPAQRAKWFVSYADFIDHYARLATRIHADLFAVGVELPGLSPYDAAWRAIIAGVRRIYPGPLVYAANFGRDFQEVAFWNDLDYVGLDEYYPLPADLSTSQLVRQVERVAVEYRKPVLFTEVGFPSLADPWRAPWDDSPRAVSLEDQARCYQAIFRAFYDMPWFEGMYWWRVGTNGAGGPRDGSFTPWGKPAMDVVREWYTSSSR